MSVGSVILNAILNRIPVSGTTFDGREVRVYTNNVDSTNDPAGLSPDLLWRSQPHLRTVVDFLARNVAQLGLHAYEITDEDRDRDRTSVLASVIRNPNDFMTTYDLVYDLIGNLSLYNRAYWFIRPGGEGFQIHPFPPGWVTVEYDSFWQPSYYTITPPSARDRAIKVKADEVLPFEGWNPSPGENSSPVETIRLILEEQYHARRHRVQVWKKSGRIGSYITRPADAPKWDNTQRQRFYKMYEAFVGDTGAKAGSDPLLEDGMDIKQTRFNSADEQWAESVKLSLESIAQVYQVNPTMVGILDAANYSNMREFNKSVYTMTLGPTIRMIEDRLNTFLLPMLGVDPAKFFLEFNVKEKLRGSFEEQAAVAATAVGSPYMTVNEFRKKDNLPSIEGGDELIRPLNMGTSTDNQPDETPSEEPKTFFYDALKSHFIRMEKVYSAKNEVDIDRFTRELAEDLGEKPSKSLRAINEIAENALKSGDFDPEGLIITVKGLQLED